MEMHRIKHWKPRHHIDETGTFHAWKKTEVRENSRRGGTGDPPQDVSLSREHQTEYIEQIILMTRQKALNPIRVITEF